MKPIDVLELMDECVKLCYGHTNWEEFNKSIKEDVYVWCCNNIEYIEENNETIPKYVKDIIKLRAKSLLRCSHELDNILRYLKRN